ncbi:serpin family protein, partial [Candidatus Fermentibacterales bacterium]|nr:serpin family protein [Candidatus Fermentibacterales bacterium]
SEGNLFFSPYSISTALGMTWAGAKMSTETQMAEVMHFTLPQSRLHDAFASLQEKLGEEYRSSLVYGEGDPLTLEVANALWVQESYPLLEEYTSLVESRYGATASNLDFWNDPEGSRLQINDWVAEKTRDRILDLIPSGVITSLTRVVLTNAVYFKGSWMHEFLEQNTSDREFATLGGEMAEVPMMFQNEHFAYGSNYGCRSIMLPYVDGMSSMLIMLPDGDILEFEESLDRETLESIMGNMMYTSVNLTMPRFEFTCSFGLKETLADMGMSDAFDPAAADFSGFTGSPELFITAVIHKAFVKVDETGTEAAAATAVVMGIESCAPPETPIDLVLDRPFLFLVRDDLTGTILFMGRVANPGT